MLQFRRIGKSLGLASTALALSVASLLSVLQPSTASAAAITSRFLELSTTVGAATASHKYSFTIPGAASTVQSMEFQYCDNPVPTVACAQTVGASGISTSGVGASPTVSGLDGTWAASAFNSNTAVRVTRSGGASASNVTTAVSPFEITFTNITNPAFDGNSPNGSNSFYVRVRVFTDNAYTTQRDRGSVASATTANIDLTAIVRETLNFCVGTSLGAGTDCATVTGTAVGLGDADDVLSLTSATTNRDHSYFRISSNGFNGSVIKYSASGTLTDGANNIDGVTSEVAFTTPGTTEQFGLAIDTTVAGGNTLCSQSSAPTNGVVADSNYNAGNETVAAASYNFSSTSNVTPVTIATAPGIVDWATCGVGYAANIAPTTPAGVYTASVNYIAVPTF
jgi:hypothetical protein